MIHTYESYSILLISNLYHIILGNGTEGGDIQFSDILSP